MEKTWIQALRAPLAWPMIAAVMLGSAHAAAPTPVPVKDSSFGCITKMSPVRGFYVDNLLGKLDETLAVARSAKGGSYPTGSVVQLVPTEVMVKQPPGTSPVTKDWEFFELNVSAEGSTIAKRGFVDVANRFGGNCFGCHVQAKPQWDLICETDHGCAPLPIKHHVFAALQRSDPRCTPAQPLSAQDQAALKELADLMKPKTP